MGINRILFWVILHVQNIYRFARLLAQVWLAERGNFTFMDLTMQLELILNTPRITSVHPDVIVLKNIDDLP